MHHDPNGELFDEKWNYQSLIGKLNFLEKSSRLDISMAVHQCTRFSNNPKKSYGEAVKGIGCYLLVTQNKGVIIDSTRYTFKMWANVSLCDNWVKEFAHNDHPQHDFELGTSFDMDVVQLSCILSWHSRFVY